MVSFWHKLWGFNPRTAARCSPETSAEGEEAMSSGERPESGTLTPQEWNRVTQSLVSLSAIMANSASAPNKTSDALDERTSEGENKK
jgi:hypothetical protein